MVKGQDLRYPHKVNKLISLSSVSRRQADNIVSNVTMLTDNRFARCQRTNPMKRIRGKPIIPGDDITETFHFSTGFWVSFLKRPASYQGPQTHLRHQPPSQNWPILYLQLHLHNPILSPGQESLPGPRTQ